MTVNKCLFVSLLFLICSVCLNAQSNRIEGKVVDADGQPLHLALVYNAELSLGTYTDEKGHFLLETEVDELELEVFALGYLRKNIYPGKETGFIRVEMEELAYDLEEVVVEPCVDKTISLGVDRESEFSSGLISSLGFGYLVGLSIPTPAEQQILEVEVMARNHRLKKGSFRLRIMSLDSLGKPAEDILQQNLIVNLPLWRTRRPIVIDMKDYQIKTPEYGILVGVEWLGLSENESRWGSRNYYTPRLGLTKIDKSEDINKWKKREGWSWEAGGVPVLDDESKHQVPYIRVNVDDCP